MLVEILGHRGACRSGPQLLFGAMSVWSRRRLASVTFLVRKLF